MNIPSQQTAEERKPAHHVIESVEMTGGYLRGARIEFVDGLNCIIGGRGSGKTTLLELLRFAIGAPVEEDQSVHVDRLIKANLAAGTVSATVRNQHGMRYVSSREGGSRARVVSKSGEVPFVSLDGDLFKMEIYTQSQIEKTASDPARQLALIDKFVEADVHRIEEAAAALDRKLRGNATEILSTTRDVEVAEDLVRELPSVTEALAALASVGGRDHDAARAMHERHRRRTGERRWHERAGEALTAIAGRVVSLDAEARKGVATGLHEERGNSPHGELFALMEGELTRVAHSIGELSSVVQKQIASSRETLAGHAQSLLARHAVEEASYRAFLEKENEDQGLMEERKRLGERHAELSQTALLLTARRAELTALRGTRAQLLSELLALRRKRFVLREQVTKQITESLSGEVRVSIIHAGNVAEYSKLLHETLRGANIRPQTFIAEIAEAIPPDALCAAVLRRDPAPIAALDESKTERTARAVRILDVLRASEKLYEIETVALEDVPLIELRVGATYRPSMHVSTGQRCTCILPILLIQAASPLLIDQPEDNLDNAFIYNVLLKSLAMAKSGRQLILVTHNPNIPVLGEAERVFVLESDGARSVISHAGTVDELREPIERILEGGRDAFRRRGQRYGHGG